MRVKLGFGMLNWSGERAGSTALCLNNSDFSSLWSSEEKKIDSEGNEHNPPSVHVASLRAWAVARCVCDC